MHLVCLNVMPLRNASPLFRGRLRQAQVPSSVQWLHWFCPQSLRRHGEDDVTVVGLCAHGYSETDAQRRDEVFSLFAVVGEGVYHLHLLAALPEVQTQSEGQPVALSVAVCAVNSDDGVYVTAPFQRDLIDFRAVCSLGCCGCEHAICGHRLPVDHHAVNQRVARLAQPCL